MRCHDECCRGEQDTGYDTVTLTTRRTSRKSRACGECGGEIKAGETYLRVFWPPEYPGGGSVTITRHANPYVCDTILSDGT